MKKPAKQKFVVAYEVKYRSGDVQHQYLKRLDVGQLGFDQTADLKFARIFTDKKKAEHEAYIQNCKGTSYDAIHRPFKVIPLEALK